MIVKRPCTPEVKHKEVKEVCQPCVYDNIPPAINISMQGKCFILTSMSENHAADILSGCSSKKLEPLSFKLFQEIQFPHTEVSEMSLGFIKLWAICKSGKQATVQHFFSSNIIINFPQHNQIEAIINIYIHYTLQNKLFILLNLQLSAILLRKCRW